MGRTIVFAGAVLAVIVLAGVWLSRRKYRKLLRLLEESRYREKEAEERAYIYGRLLPGRLLQLFQRSESEKLRIGEVRSVTAAVLSYNISGFDQIVRKQSAEEIFGFVNGILNLTVPCILYQGGEIDEYVDAGVSAFFLDTPESALRAAISVCESLNQADIREQYTMGLTYGDVIVGVVGHEKRFGTLTISKTAGLSDFLQELAIRYRVKILITGSLKRQIPDFDKRYNSRYLGDIFLKTAGTTEELYDVYDGDEAADKNGKRKTKLLFEKGVSFFQNNNIRDARLHFIEVLKANRMDGAAKEYLYLCNRYCSIENSGEVPPSYLDIY